MATILGIASSHDASACVMRDGRVLAAVSQERVTRKKNDGYRVPHEAIAHALEVAGVAPADIDAVATIHAFFPERFFRRESPGKELESRLVRARRRMSGAEERYLNVNDLLKRVGPIEAHFRQAPFLEWLGLRPDVQVGFFDHHATHASAAAWGSGFPRCAVVTVDGVGELNIHHTSGVYADGRYRRDDASDAPGTSPGEFYEAITAAMGFIALRHEGKVLGLAAHGDAQKLYAEFHRALRIADGARGFGSDFAGRPDAYQVREAYLKALVREHPREHVAAAAQAVFEDAIVALVRAYLARTGERRLALNGGVFANVKLNQRLAALAEVEELFVFPGMSDTGNSVGAALFMQERLSPGFLAAARAPLADVYWGSAWDDADCRRALDAAGLAGERLGEAALVARAADAIHAGRVLGWFQGRMEFGPRALGNRSMLARATDADINRTLNQRLERTEFMPFAPSVLAGHAAEVFAGTERAALCLPFMTITCDVREAWKARIPAVVHVDGTARPQTVSRESNPLYWSLIEAYRQRSGIPLVLNTSFNVHEEPIVCRPGEAVRALSEGRIDCLALGPYWCEPSSANSRASSS
ncbi:MAG: carbamoyltransferase [Burkholderiales bacterium]